MNFRQFGSVSWQLTLIRTKGSFVYFFCRRLSEPMESTHGGHHVPQKSSITTLPLRSSRLTYPPSAVANEKSGAKFSRARGGFSLIRWASFAFLRFGSFPR